MRRAELCDRTSDFEKGVHLEHRHEDNYSSQAARLRVTDLYGFPILGSESTLWQLHIIIIIIIIIIILLDLLSALTGKNPS